MRDKEYYKNKYQEILGKKSTVLEYIDSNHILTICNTCGSNRMINHSNIHKNCAVCSNQKVLVGYNSLCDTHPEVAKMLLNFNDGYSVTYGSGKKLIWKCPQCGCLTKPLQVCSIVEHGLSCHKCSDGNSLPNKIMFCVLENIVDNFTYEFSDDWCTYDFKGIKRTCRYDFEFEFEGFKYIIEMDGGLGHGNKKVYDNIVNGINLSTPEISKEIDKIKDGLAKSHGYHIIRIDCSDVSFESIVNNILHSELGDIFDLSFIDFNIIRDNCKTSKIVEAANLWNEGYDVSYIMSKFKVSRATVCSYLNRAYKIGLCDYTGKKSFEKSMNNQSEVCRKKNGIPVLCVTTGERFNSLIEAKEKYKCDPAVCIKKNGKYSGIYPITGEKLIWVKISNGDYI